MSSPLRRLLLLSGLLTFPLTAQAQEVGEILLLPPTVEDCEADEVLQRFRGIGRSACVIGRTSHAGGIGRVLVDGREAVLRAETGGAVVFVGYIALVEAATEVRFEVHPTFGTPALHVYALSGVAEGTPTLLRKEVTRLAAVQDSAASAEPLATPAPDAEAAVADTADPAPAPPPGTLVILEPTEWMGEGMRSVSVQVPPGDSLRVHGRVYHPAGITRVVLNGRDIPLQAHPSGQMVFLAYVQAQDVDAGVEIVAHAAQGEPMRKFFGEDPTLAAGGSAADAATPMGVTHYVDIVEPESWAVSSDRSVTAPMRRSVRVVGEAMHSGGGVRAVMIDNARASMQRQPNGSVRFFGFVPVDSVQKSVEIRVEGHTGQPIRQRYTVLPDPATLGAPGDAAATAAAGFTGERWAVVIGVSQYQDSTIQGLKYADRDAQAFHDFLRSPLAGAGGFKEENVLLLLNEQATYQALRSALRTFLKNSTEEDQVIVYFAGHGAPDPQRPDDLYLLASDTRRDDISGTGFPMADVKDAMQRVLARDVLVITDACHSGAIGGDLAMRDLETNMINDVFLTQLNASNGGIVSFTASMANQTSAEGEQWGGGHGIFTYYMLEALSGVADEDGDRIVTLVEMMEWTRDRVRRETMNAQIPNISTTSYDQLWPMSLVLDAAQLTAADAAAPRPVTTGPATRPQGGAAGASRPAVAAEVLETARERVRLFPTSANYWSDLAQVLEQAGETEESIRAYQEAARLEPGNPVRKYDLGVLLRDSGRPGAAVTAFEEAVRLSSRDARYRNALGNVLLSNGDMGRASDELERAVRLDGTVGRYHRDLAHALMQQGNFRGSVDRYEEALRLEPSIASYHHEYAQALSAAGRQPEAIDALASASRLDADNADYHRAAGQALAAAGRTAEAIEAYRQAVALEAEDARLHFELAGLFRNSGEQYGAIEGLREAVRLAPDSATYRFELGDALRQSATPEDALPEYVAAIELQPENAAFHHGYGLALHRVRQPQEAMDELREAIRLQPGNALAHFDLAKVLREAGLLDQAVAEVEQAIQLDRRNPVFRTELNEIRRQQKLIARQRN